MALETACTSYSRVFYTGKLGNSIERKLRESPGGDGTGMLENRLTLYSFRESIFAKRIGKIHVQIFQGFYFEKPMRKPLRNSPAEKYHNSLVNFS